MTIAPLVQKYKEKHTVQQLKQVYSMFSTAIAKIIADNGTLDQWSDDSQEYFENKLKENLKIIKTCGATQNEIEKCIGKNISSSGYSNRARVFILPNSMTYQVTFRHINLHTNTNTNTASHFCKASIKDITPVTSHYYACAEITLDINGKKKPNEPGKDIFGFHIYKDGIIPRGSQGVHSAQNFDTCKKRTLTLKNGLFCTAWVLYNENMDYLHCTDLDWNGKTSCK